VADPQSTSVRPILWGSELSPYALKVRALLAAAGVAYEWLPADGGFLRDYLVLARIERSKRARTVLRYPKTTALDEYPLVPYLLMDERVLYDSSAIARYLDDRRVPGTAPFVPREPLLGFVVRLVDEALDELGLPLVHHQRWVTSAATNDAGARLAREFSAMLPPLAGPRFARNFAERQVRRLPYLLSVAPPGYTAPVADALVPPSPPGFPPTHALLDETWRAYVDAVAGVLSQRPFLFGAGFTVADASVYGQLGMNLADPTACDLLRARAPRLHAWLDATWHDAHAGTTGPVALHDDLVPLLRLIGRTFVPLMVQNERAYQAALAAGETIFNERAFDRGRALYDGELLGHPFRAVVKTFQVQVWRELRAAYAALDAGDRRRASELIGAAPHDFDAAA
jgi:glutathione S-transferase